MIKFDYYPKRKCGAEALPVLGLSLGVGSLLGGLGGAAISAEGASSANAMAIGANKELQKDAQEFNEKMYKQQLADSRENWNKENVEYDRRVKQQNELQRSMMDYIFKTYSSPSAQAKAMQAAGINPAAMYMNGQSPFGNMPTDISLPNSPQSLAAPTPLASPSGSVSGLMNPNSAFAGVLTDVTASIANIAQSQLSSAQKDSINAKLDGEVTNLILKNKGLELANAYQDLSNKIYVAYGNKEAAAKVDSLVSEAFLNYANGDLSKAEEGYKKVLTTISGTQSDILKEQKPALIASAFQSLNLIKSQISANYAGAEESRANAAFTKWQTSFNKAVEAFSLEKVRSEANIAFNNEFITEGEMRKIQAAAEMAEYAASNKEAEFWKGYILDIVDGVAGSAGSLMQGRASLRSSRAFEGMSRAQQHRVQTKVDELNSIEVTEVQPTYSGKKTTRYRKRR